MPWDVVKNMNTRPRDIRVIENEVMVKVALERELMEHDLVRTEVKLSNHNQSI